MNNHVVCKNCGTENPLYGLTCTNCKSYLRERIYNIDLWKTISLLIESPLKAFQNIIFSEHKNFLILVLSLVAGKFMINGILLRIYFLEKDSHLTGYVQNYLIAFVLTIIIFLLAAWLISSALKRRKIPTRFRDNISVLIYSFLPYTFGFVILFPVELILYGGYLFYYSPSPFHIKETIAYILLSFELMLIIWSIVLTYKALHLQVGKKNYPVIISLIIHIAGNLVLYLAAEFLFI